MYRRNKLANIDWINKMPDYHCNFLGFLKLKKLPDDW